MYGWIWRKLPGGWPLKTLESIVLIVGISAVLVVVVFPWVEPKLPFSGNTVDGNTGEVTTPSDTPVPTGTTTKKPSPTDTSLPGDDDVIPGD